VLTLALGIGTDTAVFSIVDAVLLRALPYKDAERLVAVRCTEIGQPGAKIFASTRDYEEFKAHNHSFEEIAALTWARAGEIPTSYGSPHEVLAIPASAKFFSLVGISAAKGRTFGPEESQNGCTLVLARSFWEGELGAPASHKLKPFIHHRTLLPWHHFLPEKGKKRNLCIRYDLLPMFRAAQRHVRLPTSTSKNGTQPEL
jgi:hypothetical protein